MIPQCSLCKSTHVRVLTPNEGADRPPAIVFDKVNEPSMGVNENLNELLIDWAEHSGSDGSMRKSAPEPAQPPSADGSMKANEMSAVCGVLTVLGVLLLLGAAGWWLMTRRGRSLPLKGHSLHPGREGGGEVIDGSAVLISHCIAMPTNQQSNDKSAG